MKVAVFDTHPFEKVAFSQANTTYKHELHFFDVRLTAGTAALAAGFRCVCSFANDRLDAACLRILKDMGVALIALRSAGFNHVDLRVAGQLGLSVVRVPEYSPYSVAEHAVGLMLVMNRKLHRSFNRVRELNFSLDGLVGFDMHGKTVGIVGTGRIGSALAHIMRGFGCKILAYDPKPNESLIKNQQVAYVTFTELLKDAHIISLHAPLTPETRHMIDRKALAMMRPDAMLINTSRGALIDTPALIEALKHGRIGSAGLDVYEEEETIFFQDHSQDILQDDTLARLLTFPNVFITSHQGFLTKEALANIATTSLESISDFEQGKTLKNAIAFHEP